MKNSHMKPQQIKVVNDLKAARMSDQNKTFYRDRGYTQPQAVNQAKLASLNNNPPKSK